ncbi:carboxylating nicotinate-nucleotide diphosphorylase [Candidatus Peregrinibacteria bacterium]|nr:carboxylating nicotinate-nucleotide diphosphorylase [Candidatus Peregrinibacteria bacterium]
MHFFDASLALNFKNKEYLRCAERIILGAFREDQGSSGDVTTRFFVDQPRRVISAVVVAKEAGVLAGMPEAIWFLNQQGIRVAQKLTEGFSLKRRDAVMRIEGRCDHILAAERTLLNLLQRMSGVATATRKLVSLLPARTPLLATRKTLWGLLDKRAVVVGGGWTHRLHLGDAILIKDNHLKLAKDHETALVNAFKHAAHVRFIEVEVESVQAAKFVQAIYEAHQRHYRLEDRFAVLLDNFQPKVAAAIAPSLQKAGIVVEVSGNMNDATIWKYVLPGVSAISSGAITNKAAAIDMSLDIINA